MHMEMGHFTKETGQMTNKKDTEWNHGLMGQDMRVNIRMGRSINKVNLHLLMVVIMKESLNKMKYQEKDNTFGLMENFMMDYGQQIKCMERVFLNGKMGRSMKGILKVIREKDMGHLLGRMVEFIQENGKMESNTEKEYTLVKMENKNKDNG